MLNTLTFKLYKWATSLFYIVHTVEFYIKRIPGEWSPYIQDNRPFVHITG